MNTDYCNILISCYFLQQFTQGVQFTPQAQADNDRAQISPMAKAILLPRRQEKKIEDQGTSKKLPMNNANAAPEINLLEVS